MKTGLTARTLFFPGFSIISFSILVVGLGAGTVYLVVRGVLPTSLALASAFSASIAGLIVTALEDGSAGLKLMLRRMLIWRVGIGYWLFALLCLVPTFLLGSLANPIFNGDSIRLTNVQPAFDILPLFIVFFILAGIGQELGWT